MDPPLPEGFDPYRLVDHPLSKIIDKQHDRTNEQAALEQLCEQPQPISHIGARPVSNGNGEASFVVKVVATVSATIISAGIIGLTGLSISNARKLDVVVLQNASIEVNTSRLENRVSVLERQIADRSDKRQ